MKLGDDQGEGFIDLILANLFAKLPHYEHRQPLTTQARAIYDIQLGKQVCHPALFKTSEREKYAYFSTPSLFTPSNRLLVSAEAVKRHALTSPVDIKRLLEDESVTLGLISARSYGPDLDKVLKQVESQRILRMPVEKNEVMFTLIARNRIDATIAYPFELAYFNRTGQKRSDITALDIKGIPAYAIGYVACPRNSWGRQVIEHVNTALAELVHTPEYVAAMTRWWEEEVERAEFKSFYANEFLNAHVKGKTAEPMP